MHYTKRSPAAVGIAGDFSEDTPSAQPFRLAEPHRESPIFICSRTQHNEKYGIKVSFYGWQHPRSISHRQNWPMTTANASLPLHLSRARARPSPALSRLCRMMCKIGQGTRNLKRAGKLGKWWPRPGSNRRHTDFQSVALPTELPSHMCVGQGRRW